MLSQLLIQLDPLVLHFQGYLCYLIFKLRILNKDIINSIKSLSSLEVLMSCCKLLLKEVAVKEGEKGQDLEESNDTAEFGETREEALGIPIVNILRS